MQISQDFVSGKREVEWTGTNLSYFLSSYFQTSFFLERSGRFFRVIIFEDNWSSTFLCRALVLKTKHCCALIVRKQTNNRLMKMFYPYLFSFSKFTRAAFLIMVLSIILGNKILGFSSKMQTYSNFLWQ